MRKPPYGWSGSTEDFLAQVEKMPWADAMKMVSEIVGAWGIAPPGEGYKGMGQHETYLAGVVVGIRFLALQIVSCPEDAHLAKLVVILGKPGKQG